MAVITPDEWVRRHCVQQLYLYTVVCRTRALYNLQRCTYSHVNRTVNHSYYHYQWVLIRMQTFFTTDNDDVSPEWSRGVKAPPPPLTDWRTQTKFEIMFEHLKFQSFVYG